MNAHLLPHLTWGRVPTEHKESRARQRCVEHLRKAGMEFNEARFQNCIETWLGAALREHSRARREHLTEQRKARP